ncbi:MAG: TonB-dependent receptor [Bacteroidota bacterium]
MVVKSRTLLILLAYSVLLIAHSDVRCQTSFGSVQGVVTDSTTGETLPFANVVLEGTDFGSATNADGLYLISRIPPGRYRVAVSYIGYQIAVRDVIIQFGPSSRLSFALTPEPIELQTVIKTGSRFRRDDQTAVSIHPIGPEELSMVPTAVETDVFRVVRALPGVVSTSDVTAQFFVRGGGGDQNLILLDGMTIYNPFHALSLFSIFDADIIKYAEFQTGGFGVEHGTRLSSVFNIVTREGNRNRVAGKASASFLAGKILVEGPLLFSTGSWMVSARKSYFDGTLKKFVNQPLPLSFYDVVASSTLWFSDSQRFSVHLFVSGDEVRNASELEPNFQWRNRAFGIKYTQPVSNDFLFNVHLSRSFFKGELQQKSSDVRPVESSVEDLYFYANLRSIVRYPNEFMLGFMYRIPRLQYSVINAAGFRVTVDDAVSEAATWMRYKWEKPNKFGIEAGLRLNFLQLVEDVQYAFEPRLSARYNILPFLTLRGGIGRHHQQLITVTNEDDVLPLFEAWVPVVSPFRPEQADHYVAGLESTVWLDVDLSVQGYYKKFRNLVSFNRDKIDRFDPDYVQGKGESYGVEILVRKTSGKSYWWISYTLGWAFKTNNNVRYSPRFDRRHTLNVVSLVRLGKGWEVGLRWEFGSGLPFTQSAGFYDRLQFTGVFDSTYVGEVGAPYTILGPKNRARLPVYHRLDLSLSKEQRIQFLTITAKLSVVNTYDRRNIFYFNRSTGERVDQLPFLPSLNLSVSF